MEITDEYVTAGINTIKRVLDNCDDQEITLNANRWTAAQLIHDKVEEGVSLRKIAEGIGRSLGFVQRYNNVWKQFGEDSETLAFSECMTKVREPANSPEPEAPAVIEPRASNVVRPAPQNNPPAPAEPEQVYVHATDEERKAIRAQTEAFVAPIREAINGMVESVKFPCMVGTIDEMVEEIEEMDPKFITMVEVQEMYASIGRLTEKVMQIEMMLNTLAG